MLIERVGPVDADAALRFSGPKPDGARPMDHDGGDASGGQALAGEHGGSL
jgi:hypothetical protein